MKSQRPVNVNPLQYRFPITGITSILHRISGVVLFLVIPLLLSILGASLASQEGFNDIKQCMESPLTKIIMFLIVSGLLYHLVAGVRHLLMDAGIGESKEGGRRGSFLILGVSIVLSVLAVVWIW
ncbi:MAG: succinate dehydrogenase, cytochrome b556 subunit [Kangiellaceae bacterium]|nr:succinate dehydrogenase, cytochrome b556 subunit [Kangiellaceae bacterium]